jgi:predicted transglutaminase-like cysteine proteinase
MTQTTTYTSASAPASLPCLTASGSIAIPASLPLLSAAGEASVLPYGVGTLPLLWVNKSMSHQSITCNVSSTDAVKISLLEAGNDFLESLVTGLFDHADDDSFALQVTQWVADNITYLADSVDTWNNATKTLFDGYGDCEDGAILLASLLINGGVDAAKVRVYIGTYTVNETSTGHAWVEYFRDSDHRWVTLDWTMGSVYWYGIYQLSALSKTYPDMTQTYTTATEYITSTNVVALADTEAYVISLQITSMAGTFPLLTVTGADQNKGTMAGALRALTAHGTTGNFGNLSKSLPKLISSGFVGSVTADLSSTLPVFTIAATGINANRVTLSSVLPAIRMNGEAYQLNYGIVSATLPKPICSATGYPVLKMVGALELPMIKMAGAGRTARDFDSFVVKHEYDTWAYVKADLPLLTISAGGS